jgi:hypothetical protein
VTGRLAAVILLPLAGIVAIVAVFLRLHFQPPTVPPYALTSGSGDRAEAVLRPGADFEMVARPSSPPAGIVGAKGFLLRSGENRPWDAPYTTDVDGTVHIGGAVDKIFKGIPAGAWDVAVAVGRPEMLPSMPSDLERPRDEQAPAAFHVLHQRVMLAAR